MIFSPFQIGIGVVVLTLLAGSHWKAYSEGKAADKRRSDLIIAQMVEKAQSDLAIANAIIKRQTDALQILKERSERERFEERAKNDRRIADAVATDRLVRGEIANFARGAGAAEDSLSACRSDAATLGDVLGAALQAHAICSGHAETEAANARSLLAAWPRTGEVK